MLAALSAHYPATIAAHSLVATLSGAESKTDTTGASKLLVAAPFLLAALYYAISPFFAQQVRRRLADYFDKVNAEWEGPTDCIPPHLKTDAITATTDWTIDAPQMVPTLLLPLAGAVFALNDNNIVGVVLAFATVMICVATLWIYMRSPIEYQARRFAWRRYTSVSALGLALNIAVSVVLLTT
jgi:hypothetical protein